MPSEFDELYAMVGTPQELAFFGEDLPYIPLGGAQTTIRGEIVRQWLEPIPGTEIGTHRRISLKVDRAGNEGIRAQGDKVKVADDDGTGAVWRVVSEIKVIDGCLWLHLG